MAKVMKLATAGTFLLTLVFVGLFFTGGKWALAYAITFGTCFYHLSMRLIVGHTIHYKLQNHVDYTRRWYQPHPVESSLYKFLQVKKWKTNMPTYTPSVFDPRKHTWEEIAQAMCQAEIVHEVIVVLSFLPLLAAIPFGAFFVFLFTSIAAALYDLSFVIMQRYNRPRIIKFIKKERA